MISCVQSRMPAYCLYMSRYEVLILCVATASSACMAGSVADDANRGFLSGLELPAERSALLQIVARPAPQAEAIPLDFSDLGSGSRDTASASALIQWSGSNGSLFSGESSQQADASFSEPPASSSFSRLTLAPMASSRAQRGNIDQFDFSDAGHTNTVVVPLPSAGLLALGGLGMVGLTRRTRRG